jgi:UDP-GlcNAc:undecaprenyl-phosphate GlcNAc-1-phosphate transferase
MTVVPFIATAICSIAIHMLAVKLFPRIGLLDFPERYGLTRARLPYPIGLTTALLLGVAILLFGNPLTVPPTFLFGVILVLAIACLFDDRLGLPSWLRLILQIVLFLGLFLSGTRIYTLQNPLEADGILSLDTWLMSIGPFLRVPVWSGIVTIGWLLLTTNAMNWIDGVTGQVSVLSIISFVTLGFLSLSPTVAQPEVAMLCFILAGISVGSLFVTFPTPRGILGDTGAMTLGLLIGVLAMSSGGKVATAFLVLGVPLTDSLFVILRRISKAKSPFQGDSVSEHLHHRLLQKGWGQREVIALTGALSIGFGGSALFFQTTGKLIAAGVLMLVMLSLSWYSRPRA